MFSLKDLFKKKSKIEVAQNVISFVEIPPIACTCFYNGEKDALEFHFGKESECIKMENMFSDVKLIVQSFDLKDGDRLTPIQLAKITARLFPHKNIIS